MKYPFRSKASHPECPPLPILRIAYPQLAPLWFLFLSLLHHSPYLGHAGRSVLLGHAGQPSPRSAWHSPTPGNHVTCLGHAPCSPAHRPYHPGTYDFLTHSLLFLFRLLAVSPRTGVSVLRAGTFALRSVKINKGNLS